MVGRTCADLTVEYRGNTLATECTCMHACAHMQCVLALRMQQTLQLLLLLLLLQLLLVCCSRTIVPDRAVQAQCVRPCEGVCFLKAPNAPFQRGLKVF